MREMEFLPDWYPQLRRGRRFVILQLWITGVFLAALGIWMLLAQQKVHSRQMSLASKEGQIKQTDTQLQRLAELQSLQLQMSQQAMVAARLGPHVPVARLLDVLSEIMPADMALLDLNSQMESQTTAVSAIAAASGQQPTVSRRMRLKLHGVAPSDVDLGNFLARLAAIPYFSDIAMTYSRDRGDAGHAMREFEVTFTIGLNDET